MEIIKKYLEIRFVYIQEQYQNAEEPFQQNWIVYYCLVLECNSNMSLIRAVSCYSENWQAQKTNRSNRWDTQNDLYSISSDAGITLLQHPIHSDSLLIFQFSVQIDWFNSLVLFYNNAFPLSDYGYVHVDLRNAVMENFK